MRQHHCFKWHNLERRTIFLVKPSFRHLFYYGIGNLQRFNPTGKLRLNNR